MTTHIDARQRNVWWKGEASQLFCLLTTLRHSTDINHKLDLFTVTHLLCPRLGGIMRWSASVVRPSVRPSVRLMSRTSALTRKPKGLGDETLHRGTPGHMRLPRRHQGQKVKSQGGAGAYCGGHLAAQRKHQQSCHLANGCRYNVIKVLLNTAMLIIIQSNHFRVNSAV